MRCPMWCATSASAIRRCAFTCTKARPEQVAQMLRSGEADIGVATEALAGYEGLVALPCYRWTHGVVVPPGHPLLQSQQALTLEALSRFPIITYEQGYTGRAHIDEAFAREGLEPDVVLTAMDADVIKTYVELDMGVGIVASVALDAERDQGLRTLDAGHLFEVNTTRLGLRKGAWLRGYAYAFIETFVPNADARGGRAGRAPGRGARVGRRRGPASGRLARHLQQGVAGHAIADPLGLGQGAQAVVELDGGQVPVEHAPLESAAVFLDGDLRQPAQQRRARAQAARLGRDVEVFEVQAVAALPGRVIEEVDRKAHGPGRHAGRSGRRRRGCR